jgi:hypothetical protein
MCIQSMMEIGCVRMIDTTGEEWLLDCTASTPEGVSERLRLICTDAPMHPKEAWDFEKEALSMRGFVIFEPNDCYGWVFERL